MTVCKLFHDNKLTLLAAARIQDQHPYRQSHLPWDVSALSRFRIWESPMSMGIPEWKSPMGMGIPLT